MQSITAKSPLVSVFMPAYNQQEFIAAAIESVIKQDYDNIELIIGDDCSTDNTWEIIQKYQEKYPAIVKPFRNDENVGITANCNKVLARCSGKYIAFTAGDDLFLPGKLLKQVVWLEQDEKRVLCGHQVEVFYEDGSPSHILTPKLPSGGGAKWVIENGCPYGGVSIVVRKDCVPKTGYDERLIFGSDQRLWIDCLGEKGEFGYIEGIYAKYRKHSNNITGKGDIILADIESMLLHLKEEQPVLSASVKKGLVHQVNIPRARNLIRNGSYANGIVKLLWLYFLYPRRLMETILFRISKFKGLHT